MTRGQAAGGASRQAQGQNTAIKVNHAQSGVAPAFSSRASMPKNQVLATGAETQTIIGQERRMINDLISVISSMA
jgi:hypothetical protein